MTVNLSGEDFEKRGERHEVFRQSDNCSTRPTFSQFLQEQRQEGDNEHEENGDDAALDPVENGREVVTSLLTTELVPMRIVLAEL